MRADANRGRHGAQNDGAMKSAADVWICRQCRSINSIGSNRCYRCHTPIEVAAAKPEDLTIHHQEGPPPVVGVYRGSELRAVLVSVAVIAFIAAMLAVAWISWQIVDLRAAGEPVPADGLLSLLWPALAVAVGIGVVALATYGLWIRRVVSNLPALGLGYARVGPTWAFFEVMLPGFNFFAIPARLAEVTKKAGGHPRVLPLLGLALLLPVIPAGIVFWSFRVARVAGGVKGGLEVLGPGTFMLAVVCAISLLILLYVLWLVEGLLRSKAAARRADDARRRQLASPG